MDIRYILFRLKCLCVSDYRYSIISAILNSNEPETFCRSILKEFGFNKKHENIVRIEFRKIIQDAYNNKVPLADDLLDNLSAEDAYLVRQKYLSKFMNTGIFSSGIINILLCLFIGAICVFCVLLFT
ncbi:hypothetical protein [Succinivibrio sp.]|uniref:hypothetical protein n=1 Tax=Succinivibrio sp. TaxID=2053619 RepID=UPI003865C362